MASCFSPSRPAAPRRGGRWLLRGRGPGERRADEVGFADRDAADGDPVDARDDGDPQRHRDDQPPGSDGDAPARDNGHRDRSAGDDAGVGHHADGDGVDARHDRDRTCGHRLGAVGSGASPPDDRPTHAADSGCRRDDHVDAGHAAEGFVTTFRYDGRSQCTARAPDPDKSRRRLRVIGNDADDGTRRHGWRNGARGLAEGCVDRNALEPGSRQGSLEPEQARATCSSPSSPAGPAGASADAHEALGTSPHVRVGERGARELPGHRPGAGLHPRRPADGRRTSGAQQDRVPGAGPGPSASAGRLQDRSSRREGRHALAATTRDRRRRPRCPPRHASAGGTL
jgi:hypothetical protein